MKLPVLRPFEVIFWGTDKDRPLWRTGVEAFSEDEAKASALDQFARLPSQIQRLPSGALAGRRDIVSRVEVLSDVHLNTARKQQTLFEDLADACIGASLADIQGACINMLLTAVQRRCVKLADAEARWDELTGRGKVALQRRYSGAADPAEPDIARRLTG